MEVNSISALVSVIMPCYNASQTVEMAVRSVMSQNYDCWELFVIDDCSTDDTLKIISSLQKCDKRISVIRNPKRLGAAASRNIGINQSKGGYIAFIDADDFWYANKLAEQVRYMDEHRAVISCTAYRYMNIRSEMVGRAVCPPEKISFKRLLRSNSLCCPTVMVSSDVMKRHLFEPTVFHEDYAAWLEIVKETDAAHGMSQVLSLYRIGHVSKSANKVNSAGRVYDIYKRYYGFCFARCLCLMFFYGINGITKYLRRFSFSAKKQIVSQSTSGER